MKLLKMDILLIPYNWKFAVYYNLSHSSHCLTFLQIKFGHAIPDMQLRACIKLPSSCTIGNQYFSQLSKMRHCLSSVCIQAVIKHCTKYKLIAHLKDHACRDSSLRSVIDA